MSKPPRTGWRRLVPTWKFLLGSAIVVVLLGAAAFTAAVVLTPVPEPNEVARAQTSIVYWNDGVTEIGRLGDVNRVDVPLSSVPLHVQRAVLAAEDRDFYTHGGVSPTGIGRAVWNNLRGGSTQGASTITQQYAKNAFLSQERSWQRKARELVLSVKLETTVGKDEILGNYLNTVYFGRGAYGIESAARAYFRVPAAELTVAQGAMLAALLKSPEGMSPDRAPERLEARWNYVLDGMVEQRWLSRAERRSLEFPEVAPRSSSDRPSGTDGYLIDAVRQDLTRVGITEAELGLGGLRIVSTFDKAAQESAVRAVEEEAPTETTEGLRIGLAAVRPGTGEVVALYGGADYRTNQLNNATMAIGQAGSTFKPFALAAALEQGIGLDSVWNGDNGRDIGGYTVVNYGDESWGDISLLTATENSVNSAYVDLENTIGVDAVADAAVRAGIPADTVGLVRNLTFVLGTSSPRAIDLAHSYATFAARGVQAQPTTIARVFGAQGDLVFEAQPEPQTAFTSDVADRVNVALQRVVSDGTGYAATELGRPAAGKTGTTNDNMSAWFVGYTPQLSTAVMMVKDGPDGMPVSLAGTGGMDTVTGGSYPARIWTAFMAGALEGMEVVDFVDPFASDEVTTPTDSQSPTMTPTDSPSPTVTPTDSPSPTASPTESPSPTDSPTPTDSPAPTESPSPTDPPSSTESPTPTESPAPTEPPVPDPTSTGAAAG